MNQREKGYKNLIAKPKIGRLARKILLLFCLSLLLAIATANISLVQAKQPIFLATEETETADDESESFTEIVADYEKLDGLFTIYRHPENGKLLIEVKPEQLNKNYLCFVTLNSGIGSGLLIRGMPISDFPFQWRRHQDSLQFVIPNIYFRTNSNDPQSRSLNNSFSDSVLYSIPIKAIHPERETMLIDLADLLIDGDLAGMKEFLLYSSLYEGGDFEPQKTYFSEAKAFPLNLEIESVLKVSNSGFWHLPSLPDNRAFDLRIRYSFSEVPINNGYRPRFADERLGYFITAYKDFSDRSQREPFVRYINRWHLEKQIPTAPFSAPIEPIVFWIENTVPVEYRDAIREGVLMWNKAFEKAGFIDAIQVRQMPDDATWDPADVRYNTIIWSTTFEPIFEGLGPSRVNPLTGQILDADLIIDGNVVRNLKYGGVGRSIELSRGMRRGAGSPQTGAASNRQDRQPSSNLCAVNMYSRYLGELGEQSEEIETDLLVPETLKAQYQYFNNSFLSQLSSSQHLCFGWQSIRQLNLGAIAMDLSTNIVPSNALEEYVKQYLKYLIAHEVGHTLGLRHNFHGSTMLAPEELHETRITRTKGLVASVMDYVPVNLAPPGVQQGDYFPVIVGPYDDWAIEYGYTSIPTSNYQSEKPFLEEIARRASAPELSYAPDEDSFDTLDPQANFFDLSGDTLAYSRSQLDNARAMWERLEKRFPDSDESYSETRMMFDTVFFHYLRQILDTTLYVGGQSFNRGARGDNGQLPFEPISVEQQREALKILDEYLFAENAFSFSPELLNKLAPSRWSHWGNPVLVFPLDYPIQDEILFLQRIALRSLFSELRLSRLRDLELKTEPENALSVPELFETVQNSVWKEVLSPPGGAMEISGIRRSLQREHLNILTAMVLRNHQVPEDARSLAWARLRELRSKLGKTISRRGGSMDDYTRAHLEEARDRIIKTLSADVQSE